MDAQPTPGVQILSFHFLYIINFTFKQNDNIFFGTWWPQLSLFRIVLPLACCQIPCINIYHVISMCFCLSTSGRKPITSQFTCTYCEFE